MRNRYVINGIFLARRLTGIERYAVNLVKELDKLVKPGGMVLLIPGTCDKTLGLKNIKEVRYGRFKGYLWEQTDLPFYANRRHAKVISLCNTVSVLSPRGIITLHDIVLKTRSHFFDSTIRGKISVTCWKIMYRMILCSKAEIVTDSFFSRSEILRVYNAAPERIKVIHLGWQHINEIKPDDEILKRLGLKKGGYYFSMGTAMANKNIKWVIEAAGKNPDKTFVLAGHNSIEKTGKDIPPNLIPAGYVSDEEAKALMGNCHAFIQPTFYEGFGLPPMEALASGAKGVIVSDTPCMREVYGDIADYIDPYDYDIISVTVNQRTREEIEAFLNKYSWEAAAKEFVKLLRRDHQRSFCKGTGYPFLGLVI